MVSAGPRLSEEFTVHTSKALIVSKDEEDLTFYSAALAALGYDIERCRSYEDGARRIGDCEFDVVVLSQGSPAFEGRQVLESNAKLDRRRPILVVTRSHDVHCYLEAMDLGAIDYLERPQPKDIEWVLGIEPSARGRTLSA
jgi:DNA-binding NtrC family response regulator